MEADRAVAATAAMVAMWPTMEQHGPDAVCRECDAVTICGGYTTMQLVAHRFELSAAQDMIVVRCRCGYEHCRFGVPHIRPAWYGYVPVNFAGNTARLEG